MQKGWLTITTTRPPLKDLCWFHFDKQQFPVRNLHWTLPFVRKGQAYPKRGKSHLALKINRFRWASCWGEQTEQGRESIFLLPPTLNLLPQEVRRKPGFQIHCSTSVSIHILLISFWNHHEWTKPWINIVKTVQMIHFLTGPTQQSQLMNNYTGTAPRDYLQFRPIVA